MTICDYCGTKIKRPLKVGKMLKYCDSNCFALDCLKRYPCTSLAGMVKTMYPEVANHETEIR